MHVLCSLSPLLPIYLEEFAYWLVEIEVSISRKLEVKGEIKELQTHIQNSNCQIALKLRVHWTWKKKSRCIICLEENGLLTVFLAQLSTKYINSTEHLADEKVGAEGVSPSKEPICAFLLLHAIRLSVQPLLCLQSVSVAQFVPVRSATFTIVASGIISPGMPLEPAPSQASEG